MALYAARRLPTATSIDRTRAEQMKQYSREDTEASSEALVARSTERNDVQPPKEIFYQDTFSRVNHGAFFIDEGPDSDSEPEENLKDREFPQVQVQERRVIHQDRVRYPLHCSADLIDQQPWHSAEVGLRDGTRLQIHRVPTYRNNQFMPAIRIGLGDFPEQPRQGQFSSESSDHDDSDESCDEAMPSDLKDEKKAIDAFLQSNASSLAKFYPASVDPKEEKLPTKAEEQQPCYLSKAGSTSESQQQYNNITDDSRESAPTFISECVPAVRPQRARKDRQAVRDSQVAKDRQVIKDSHDTKDIENDQDDKDPIAVAYMHAVSSDSDGRNGSEESDSLMTPPPLSDSSNEWITSPPPAPVTVSEESTATDTVESDSSSDGTIDITNTPFFTFGKHVDKDFMTVAQTTTYYHWARTQPDPSANLKHFLRWVEDRYAPDPQEQTLGH